MNAPHLPFLESAEAQQHLRPLDLAFARFLAERDAQAPPALLLLAAVLSRQLADGHLCLDLAQLGAQAETQGWPAHWCALANSLRAGLPPSPLLANADGMPANAPLVHDGTRLYLRRYWNHERTVASSILQRVAQQLPASPHLAAELARLFPAGAAAGSPHQSGNGEAGHEEDTDGEAIPAPNASTADWPRIACALAARGAFSVITGGPGTGKTTTVVRLLGLLQTLALREHGQALRICLAAPTGKAAARLNESIARQLAQLDVDDAVRTSIPAEVTTLHRLLGARPDTRRFRHHHANPLPLDVLVVDEASMVDLEMVAALLDALPAQARLVLLGDKDQLSSVEAGAVLGDLCRRAEAGHYSAATASWLRQAGCGDIGAFTRDDALPLDQHIAMLRVSHRFAQASGIGQLARAVNGGDIRSVHAVLAAGHANLAWLSGHAPILTLAIEGHPHSTHAVHRTMPQHHPDEDGASAEHAERPPRGPAGASMPSQPATSGDEAGKAADEPHSPLKSAISIHRHDAPYGLLPTPGSWASDGMPNHTPRGYRHYLELLHRLRPADDAGEEAFAVWAREVLHAHGDFQLLCALRNGPFGTRALNQRIAAALQACGLIQASHGWYEGRPVMVLRNDYTLGLMNGDVGITLRCPDGHGVLRLCVAFADGSLDAARHGVRFVPPSRLPECETVYAMTVHKSQGSEFAHTALVLPPQASATLSRELLYTGITRARQHFTLVADAESMAAAVAQRTRRHSGLAARLGMSHEHEGTR